MPKDNCSVQITLRADSAPMVNVYAESPSDALGILQELEALGLNALLFAWTSEARAAAPVAPQVAKPPAETPPAPDKPKASPPVAAPQHQNRKPVDTYDPDEGTDDRCPKHDREMRPSDYGGLFCTSKDPDEADGRCRWVLDGKTGQFRRKPTRAELDAAKAANRRGQAVYE